VGRLLRMHAKPARDIEVAYAGDIVAGLGFKQTTTGDTLSTRENAIVLEKMIFPEPVIQVAIEPKTKVDQDKLGKALNSLSDEDPPSRCTPTTRPARRSSPVWANCTSRSSSIA